MTSEPNTKLFGSITRLEIFSARKKPARSTSISDTVKSVRNSVLRYCYARCTKNHANHSFIQGLVVNIGDNTVMGRIAGLASGLETGETPIGELYESFVRKRPLV